MTPSSPLGTRRGPTCPVRPVLLLTRWNSYGQLTHLRHDVRTSFSTFRATAVVKKQGHQSLQFCFVKKRTASGIAEWDNMGFT